MSDDLNTALIAAAGVLITAILGLVAAWIANKARNHERFQSALEFLCGETQNRSIGIALLRSYGERDAARRQIVEDIFRAQQMHLLDKGYGRDSGWERRIERYNFLLLQEVLAKWGKAVSPTAESFARAELERAYAPAPRVGGATASSECAASPNDT